MTGVIRIAGLAVAAMLMCAPVGAISVTSLAYSTSAGYSAGGSAYDNGLTWTSGGDTGADSLAYSATGVAGPIAGWLSMSGHAATSFGIFQSDLSVTLTDYGLGSYTSVYVDNGSHVVNLAAQTLSAHVDSVTLVGGSGLYDVQFTYHVSGTSAYDQGGAFVPWVFPEAIFNSSSGFYARGYQVLVPANGSTDNTISFITEGIPANEVLSLQLGLNLWMIADESWVGATTDPSDPNFQLTGDSGYNVNLNGASPNTYSLNFSADFSHTMTLTNVAIFDPGTTDPAQGVSLLSDSGQNYPGVVGIPEPATWVLGGVGLALLAGFRRTR